MIRTVFYAVVALLVSGLAVFLTTYSVIPTAERMLAHPWSTSALVMPPAENYPGSAAFDVDGVRHEIIPDLPAEAYMELPDYPAPAAATIFYDPADPANATLVNPSPPIATILASLGLASIIVAFAMWRLVFARVVTDRFERREEAVV